LRISDFFQSEIRKALSHSFYRLRFDFFFSFFFDFFFGFALRFAFDPGFGLLFGFGFFFALAFALAFFFGVALGLGLGFALTFAFGLAVAFAFLPLLSWTVIAKSGHIISQILQWMHCSGAATRGTLTPFSVISSLHLKTSFGQTCRHIPHALHQSRLIFTGSVFIFCAMLPFI
jgi:hypothetical protein